MKTQVLQIDIHDDLISIRDRMTWAKTPRLLLVWPLRGKVGVRPLDLSLLRRHALSLGAELGLVTRDREIRRVADTLRISVFSKTSDAQKKQWIEKRGFHTARHSEHIDFRKVRENLPVSEIFTFGTDPIYRMAIFAFGVLSVLAIVLVFIPSAVIQITLPEKEQILMIALRAEPGVKNVDISGVVPQRKLSLTVEGNETAWATGTIVRPDKTAAGKVVFMNLSESAVNAASGTIIFSQTEPPVAFLTENEIVVPAGKGKMVSVSIRAKTPGLSGNVGPGLVTIIQGLLDSKVAITNPDAIAGGTQSTQMITTEQDRNNLRKRLLSNLQQRALKQFIDQIPTGDVLFLNSLMQSRILEETYAPAIGEAVEKVKLSMQVEFNVAYASSADLHLLAQRVLDASVPVGYVPAEGDINLTPFPGFSEGRGIVHWQMRAERIIRPVPDSGLIISLSQGKSTKDANSILMQTFGLLNAPEIYIRPGWWPWLPLLPNRIEVKG